jgi:hypothetical protein
MLKPPNNPDSWARKDIRGISCPAVRHHGSGRSHAVNGISRFSELRDMPKKSQNDRYTLGTVRHWSMKSADSAPGGGRLVRLDAGDIKRM